VGGEAGEAGEDAPTDAPADARESGTDAAVSGGVRIGMNPGEGYTTADIATWSTYITQLHATAVRLFFPIYTWTPSGPDDAAHYYWPDNVTEIQKEIEGYTAQGFRVTVTMAAGPCSSTQVCPGLPAPTGQTRSDGSPANQFDEFLQTFVAAIGMADFAKISAVEVWNEWDNAGNGHPYGYANGSGWAQYTATQYVDDLLHAGYVTLKGYNPNVEIIAGAVITGREADIAALAAAGAGQWADAFSYHPYYSTIANLTAGLQTAKSGVPAGKGLTLTEWGCNAGSIDAPATSGSASTLTASFAVLRAAGLEEADYYVLNSAEFAPADQAAYGLVSAILTGSGPNLQVSSAAAQAPLFNAFEVGAQ
jgi:hypothetical protein